jgi:hypothetical protein
MQHYFLLTFVFLEVLSQLTFFLFYLLSQLALFPFDIMSHSAFFLSMFCLSMFFTIAVFDFDNLSVNRADCISAYGVQCSSVVSTLDC